MSKLHLVAVSGGLQRPSKTLALVQSIVTRLEAEVPVESQVIDLSDLVPHFNIAPRHAHDLAPLLRDHIKVIEQADILVVGTPVYRGSYSGLFKHLFDLVDLNSLIDIPVLLSATGGSERHALMIETELRPLFSFFQSLTLPIGIYGTDKDFTDYRITDPLLQARLDLAINRAVPLLANRRPRRELITQAAA